MLRWRLSIFLVCRSRLGIISVGGLRGLVAESSQVGFELASASRQVVGCCKPGGNRRSVCDHRSLVAAGSSRDVYGSLSLKHGDVIGDTVTNLQAFQDAILLFLQLCSDHWSLLRAIDAARHRASLTKDHHLGPGGTDILVPFDEAAPLVPHRLVSPRDQAQIYGDRGTSCQRL